MLMLPLRPHLPPSPGGRAEAHPPRGGLRFLWLVWTSVEVHLAGATEHLVHVGFTVHGPVGRSRAKVVQVHLVHRVGVTDVTVCATETEFALDGAEDAHVGSQAEHLVTGGTESNHRGSTGGNTQKAVSQEATKSTDGGTRDVWGVSTGGHPRSVVAGNLADSRLSKAGECATKEHSTSESNEALPSGKVVGNPLVGVSQGQLLADTGLLATDGAAAGGCLTTTCWTAASGGTAAHSAAASRLAAAGGAATTGGGTTTRGAATAGRLTTGRLATTGRAAATSRRLATGRLAATGRAASCRGLATSRATTAGRSLATTSGRLAPGGLATTRGRLTTCWRLASGRRLSSCGCFSSSHSITSFCCFGPRGLLTTVSLSFSGWIYHHKFREGHDTPKYAVHIKYALITSYII